MINQERTFINFVDEEHPLLQEMPKNFRDLWFHSFQSYTTKDRLFLNMERIYQYDNKKGGILDLLIFEIADFEALVEWEEEFPDQPFVAADPYYIFYDGMDGDRGMFSLGDLDLETMNFEPELEIFISFNDKGELIIDFDDQEIPEVWVPYP